MFVFYLKQLLMLLIVFFAEVDTEKKLVIVLLAEEAPIKFGLGILSEVEFQDDMPGRM